MLKEVRRRCHVPVRSFLKNKPIPYPVLLDPEDKVSKKGKVTFFHTGVADGATVRKVLKEAGV